MFTSFSFSEICYWRVLSLCVLKCWFIQSKTGECTLQPCLSDTDDARGWDCCWVCLCWWLPGGETHAQHSLTEINQSIWQQPVLPGGPTTSPLVAANFLLEAEGLTDFWLVTCCWWWPAVLGLSVTPVLVSGLMLTLCWPGLSGLSWLEEDRELEPDTLLWERVLLRSARVPGGEWYDVEELFWTTPGLLMVTDTWMLMGSWLGLLEPGLLA